MGRYDTEEKLSANREYQRKWYYKNLAKNRETKRARSKGARRHQRELFSLYKLERGCEVCGYNACPRSLHFHHLEPGGKEYGIAIKMRHSSLAHVMSEIEKCVLLCANCHGELHDGLPVLQDSGVAR